MKSRVILSNTSKSYLFVIAKRVEIVEIFKVIPQQSDYHNILWEQGQNDAQITANQKPISVFTKVLNKLKKWASFFSPIGDGNPDYFNKLK